MKFTKTLSFALILAALISLVAETLVVEIGFLPDSRILLLLMSVTLFVLKLNKVQLFSKRSHLINYYWIFPALLFLTLTSLWMEKQHGLNYVYIEYGITYSRLIYLLLWSFVLGLYGSPISNLKSFLKQLIFVAPFVLTAGAIFIFLRRPDLFRFAVAEDSIVEYAQFILFLGSSLISFLLSKYWWGKNKAFAILWLLTGIGFMMVAGEEISWGQRLLNFETPAEIKEVNIQNELNIHNTGTLFGYVYRGYMLIGLFGSVGWLIKLGLQKLVSTKLKKILDDVIPNWYFTPYFFVAFAYNFERFYLNHRVGEALWEEPMELLLVLAIFIFLLENFIRKNDILKQIVIKHEDSDA